MQDNPELAAYLGQAPMIRMAQHFDDLAAGRLQVPSQPVRTRVRERIADADVLAYHDAMVDRVGPLFAHFLASVPFVLEELARIGVALTRYCDEASRAGGQRRFTFYEVDAFDGSNGRTLAGFAKGRLLTFSNSPNPANEPSFRRHADPARSWFQLGTYLHIEPSLFASREDLAPFRGGFDFIYEMVSFQFYGCDRDAQIAHVARMLKPRGLAFFLEKLLHDDAAEYERRERVKDEGHKAHYFTAEEIEWKRRQMLAQMHTGQVRFGELAAAIGKHFRHVYLLWNSTNFYEFAASNDASEIERFIALLGPSVVPLEFAFEAPMQRRVRPVDGSR
jgi:hypothetical protein